ncbi:MAG: sigma-70 family RNA polymerase sigma factor [Actinomycetota bacterium]
MTGDEAGEETSTAQMSMVAASALRFDDFFVANQQEMVRALALALGDAELGRDAASEGFCRALERWKKVGRYEKPAGWVYRAGLNWATSRRRKKRREAVGDVPEQSSPAIAPSDQELVRCLRQLSIAHRSVIVSRYYLDWSEAQTAAALDIPQGTVKSRLSRALEQLATMLETP